MEGRHQRNSPVLVPGSANFRDRNLASQQQARRGAPQRDDRTGLDGVDLAIQKRLAGGDLVGMGRAVLGWSALHDVADVDFAALNLETKFNHLCQEFTGAAHEGQSAPIFFFPGSLSDEHQRCVRIAVSEYDPIAALAERAARALAEFEPHGLESLC